MFKKQERQRVEVLDLSAPITTLTEHETNGVKGGNPGLVFSLVFEAGRYFADRENHWTTKLGNKIGDWAYNKFGKR